MTITETITNVVIKRLDDNIIIDKFKVHNYTGLGLAFLSAEVSHTDSGSVTIGTISSTKKILKVVLSISQAFDADVQFTVGDIVAQGRLMTASENNSMVIANYITQPDYQYSVNTELKLFISGVATTGKGEIIIYYL